MLATATSINSTTHHHDPVARQAATKGDERHHILLIHPDDHRIRLRTTLTRSGYLRFFARSTKGRGGADKGELSEGEHHESRKP